VVSLGCCLSGGLDGFAAVRLDKLDHLGDGFRGENWEEVCDEDELVGLGAVGLARTELAESDSLAVVGSASASVDKGRVVAVHIEVLVVDEETFTYRGVPVIKRVHVEPAKTTNDKQSAWLRRLV
jgi:hypothetical protein